MLDLFSPSIVGRAATPLFVTLVSFWHFAVYRGQTLTPSIAFTSMAGNVVVYVRGYILLIIPSLVVFSELKFALNALPETLISMLQVRFLFLEPEDNVRRFLRRASCLFVGLRSTFTRRKSKYPLRSMELNKA